MTRSDQRTHRGGQGSFAPPVRLLTPSLARTASRIVAVDAGRHALDSPRGSCTRRFPNLGHGTEPLMNPALIVVGADKGGVGKTTVSRLLLDYLASRKTPARAFDAEHPRGTLARFHGDTTEIVDLTQTADQMKII